MGAPNAENSLAHGSDGISVHDAVSDGTDDGSDGNDGGSDGDDHFHHHRRRRHPRLVVRAASLRTTVASKL